ncbi:MAG: hypothetical protein CVU06_07320 [Bacteroidetes bacterium HGW-Bacteroidetes-22]|nr:MAG: hypothetical protein CVU06_07320 [Bacteroidetes bacterium HGW-Bacteroidetes-22]
MFVTVFYAIINLKTGQIDYVNAGHNPPYILKENGEVVTVEPSGDMILGVFEDHEYRAMQVQLTPQQGILLFTDGVTEAFNALDEAYGEARLETVLSAAAGLPAQTVVGTLNEDVARFAMGTQQSDDITMLYLKYIG